MDTITQDLLDICLELKAIVLKHGKHNQKTHGNRFGAGQAKESLRRLKDDKQARERYKQQARKRGQGRGAGGGTATKPPTLEEKIKEGVEERWGEDTVKQWLLVNNNKTVYEMTQSEFVNREGRGVGFNGAKLPKDPALVELEQKRETAIDELYNNKLGFIVGSSNPRQARMGLTKKQQKLVKKYDDAQAAELAHMNKTRTQRQKELHKVIIESAIKNGRHVPEHVRKEYGL